MKNMPVYLDHHATTPVDPRVVAAMTPYWTEQFGNAASFQHAYGQRAKAAIDQARKQISELISADPEEIVFTSGATESNNLAIHGILQPAIRRAQNGNWKPHVVTTSVEHRSVLDPLKKLERRGVEVTYLPVSNTGCVTAGQVEQAIRPETKLVSVIWANNEVGSLNPISEIATVCQKQNVLFHTDAVQAMGKVDVNLKEVKADLLSFTAHKMYGPQGIGGLHITQHGKSKIQLEAMLEGGGHQAGRRSGTLPLALIVGLGAACEIAQQERETEQTRIETLRNLLQESLQVQISGMQVNGHQENRLAGNLNISIPDVDGEALMTRLTKIAVSSGSACTSSNSEPSHVLKAMGISENLCKSSLRFGIGRFNTEAEIRLASEHLREIVAELRS